MSKVARIVIFVIYAVGTVLGMLLAGSTTVANLEADFYFGFSYQGEESLKGLECPILVTGDEVGTVSVTLDNPHEKEIQPIMQVDIGNEGMFRSYRERMYIPAGESGSLQWAISKDDVVFKHLILFKLFQFAAFKTPTRDGSCGIVYLDVPFNGTAVLIFTIALSLGGMALGIILWIRSKQSQTALKTRLSRAMIVMAISVVLAMATGILGVWLLGVLFFIISLLLIAEVVRSFIATD